MPEGTYQVGAGNYQGFVFDMWQDGEKSPYHSLTLTNSTDLVAIYKSDLANLKVESYDNLGNTIKGFV